MNLSITEELFLKRINRAGIKTGLGVPRQKGTAEIYADTSTLPIVYLATNRLLVQLLRLHKTISGRLILEKVAACTECQEPIQLKALRELLEYLQLLPRSPWPWSLHCMK